MSMLLNPYRFVTGGGGGGETDPHFLNVVSLLHFDGADGSTTITDQVLGRSWSAVNGAHIETDFSKFGGSSAQCTNVPGVGVDDGSFFGHSNHADFRLGTGDWTWEGWFRPQAPTTSFGAVFRKGENTTSGITLAITPTLLTFRANGTTDSSVAVSLSTTSFTHIAFVRSGGNVLAFVGGSLVATWARSFDHSSTDPVYLGSASSNSNFAYKGYFDDIRITKGVARYTTSFTAPTAAFPNS